MICKLCGKNYQEEGVFKNLNDRTSNGVMISIPQQRRLYAISKESGIENLDSWLTVNFGISNATMIMRGKQYEEICKAAENSK